MHSSLLVAVIGRAKMLPEDVWHCLWLQHTGAVSVEVVVELAWQKAGMSWEVVAGL
jgi:hypothetical protein